MSRDFCRDVPIPGGVQKVCAKKFVRIFRSLEGAVERGVKSTLKKAHKP